MPDIVLTADRSVLINYRLTCFGGFIACVPRHSLPPLFRSFVERRLFEPAPTNSEGQAEIATLGLRKVESVLLEHGFDVVVCDSAQVGRFEAKVYGISAIDPLGIGPATSTMMGFSSTKDPFNKLYFEELVREIRETRPEAIILVGGPGAWQFDALEGMQEKLGIDCVVQGEVEEVARDLFGAALRGRVPRRVLAPIARRPAGLKKPTLWGMVQLGRGCDRGCRFCSPGTGPLSWRPVEEIVEDAKVNVRSKYVDSIAFVAEDMLRYGNRPGEWAPCGEIVRLSQEVRKLGKPVSPTHANLSSVAASPEVVRDYAKALELKEGRLAAFQVGLETGSPRLMSAYMRGKALPWKPEEWPEVARCGFEVLAKNHIIPAATLVAGLKEETEEDIEQTIGLVKELRGFPSVIIPLFFVPLGRLKGDVPFLKGSMSDGHKELYTVCFEHTAYWARVFTSWCSNELSFASRWLLHVGTVLAFDYFVSLRRSRRLPPGWWPYHLLKENALFFTSRFHRQAGFERREKQWV